MALGRSRNGGDKSHPGEPGVGIDYAPPFTADDDATRWLFALNRQGIRPGLQRINGVLEDLGNPQNNLKTLVVAGTNGKGSTTRVLALLLQSAGYKVATYTSPHLLAVHERILINDVPVEAEDFARRVDAIKPLVDKHEASWFETLTALAVQLASDHQVDFLVCETGLGGRLDASNALPSVATLLTTVGLDHQHILGETLAEITAEKLGLLKAGSPLFCGVEAALRPQVFRTAVEESVPCFFLDELADWPSDLDQAATWQLTLRDRVFADLPDQGTSALRRNVALSLLTLSELEKKLGQNLLPDDISAALGNLFLPGRYQRVLCEPDWIFDTAHNAQALTVALTEFTRRPCPGRRVVLFGAMHDKGMDPSLGVLLAACDLVVGTPVSLPRSRTVQELDELFRDWQMIPSAWSQRQTAGPSSLVAPDMAAALIWLAQTLDPTDRVLVTGSCFTVAEAFYQLGFERLETTRHATSAETILTRLKERS